MTIQNILRQHKVKGVFHTHVSMGQTKGKYNLSRDDLENFFSNYNPEKNTICLAEKPQKYSAVLVDIDIKRKSENATVKRTEKHITDVVKAYQEVLKEIVKDVKEKDLTCVFLDKPIYEETKNKITYVKNGFHLHFPYIFLDKDVQKIHLIPRVKEKIKELKTFQDLGFENSGELVDDTTCKPWLIYGAVKEEGKEPYKISKVFNSKCEEISLEKGLINYPLQNKQEKKIKLQSQEDIIENLPKILSIIPLFRDFSIIKEPKFGLVNPNKIEHREKRERTEYKDKNVSELLKDARELVKIISDDRADNREDWLKIGWCLYNISEGSDEGFQIWNEFSQRCGDKYDESVCEYTWSKMQEGTLGIGTLHYYAKLDDKKQYTKIVRKNNKDILYESLNGSHYDIAQVFQNIHGYNNVKITSQKDLSCFLWNDKTKLWVESGKETLCKLISDIVSPIYIKMGTEILKKLQSCSDKGEEAMCNTRLKQVQKIISNLKSTPYINNIAKALAGHEIDKDFETTVINRKSNELPLKDGKLIDLKTLEVRDRCFTDYWSFECNASFLGEKANLSCVEKFFNDISCGSENLVDYHRRLWGYLLTGEISDRSLHIFWGNGCNGKSSVVNIFSNITKNFTAALSEDVMLKKTSRGANPEMMPLLTARCGSLPESDKKEELNSKRVKSITGDDVITARHLFGHAVSFKTQCKPIWATNHKPKINVDDQAILDRLKLIPFLARFEKNQENTDYIKDLQENKLDEFLTWFCLGAYDWYSGEELTPCSEMNSEMTKYISENDVVAEFLEDTYHLITKEEYNKIPKLDKRNFVQNRIHVYGEFVAWISDNNRKDDSLGKKDFYEQFDKKVTDIRTTKIKKGFLAKKKDTGMTDVEGEEEEDGRPLM